MKSTIPRTGLTVSGDPITCSLSDYVAPTVGVISDPMLKYFICYLVYLGAYAKIQPKVSKFERDISILKFCGIES